METEDIPAHPEYTELARRYAADVLRHHGMANDLAPDGALYLDGRRVRIEWSAKKDEGSLDGHCRVTLHCLIWSERYPEAPIETWLSGYGDHGPAAIADALVDWMHRVFEPVGAALGLIEREPAGTMASVTDSGADQVSVEWAVYEGEPALLHAGPPAAPSVEEVIGDQLPLGLVVDPVCDGVNTFPERRLHWVKLFLVRRADGTRVTECLVDNLPHPGTPRLETFRWPAYDGLLGLRYFAVFVARERHRVTSEAPTP